MKIILSGATGFIGQQLVRALLQHNHEIYIVTTNKQHADKLFGNHVKIYSWSELNKLIPDEFSVVINLSGENIAQSRWTEERKQKIINSRLKTTDQWVSWIASAKNKLPHLYNASAIGVYGLQTNHDDSIFTENTDLTEKPVTDFIRYVAKTWEEAAQKTSGALTLLRFGIVLGQQGGMLKKLLPSFKLGLGMVLGSGQQALSWIYVEDVVNAILFLLNNMHIQGPINFVAPQIVTQQVFADTLAKALNRPRLFKMPAPLVKLLFGEMGTELLLGNQHVYSQRLAESAYQFKLPDLNAAIKRVKTYE